MTDKIPEGVLREAHRVRDELCIDCECKFDAGCGCLEAISRALLARDQRAAEIARRWEQSSWADEVFAARSIAEAILSYDEAQQ